MSRTFSKPAVPVYSRGSVSTPGSPMPGLMQRTPLLIQNLLIHASTFHPHRAITSRLPELPAGPWHRYTFRDMSVRAQRLANALVQQLGVGMGAVVASMATNTHRHLELYYAVSGMGAILHTINPRLFAEQINWMLNHAEAAVIFVDMAFVPVLVDLVKRGNIRCRHFVVMTDAGHMPTLPFNALCYETVLAAAAEAFEWPTFGEDAASMLCYTSGTTGNPKGVLFSHRSTLLHAYALVPRDAIEVSSRDVVLCTVPFCHVSGWGMPYAVMIVGAAVVLPGTGLDPPSLYQLLSEARVTMTCGVPSVWLGLLHYLDEHPELKLPALDRVMVGGSAAPPSMITRFTDKGVHCVHVWGMTEMSPLGTICRVLPDHDALSEEERFRVKVKQGRAQFGIQMKIVDADGKALPWDGKAYGDLLVRGPAVTCGYYKVGRDGREAASWDEQCNVDAESWFCTGDVATIDPHGFMHIVDRSKDVIKSGGEWVSSIDLENTAVGHPGIAEAAVIGVRQSKWRERPLLLVVRKKGASVQEADVLGFLKDKVARWSLPEGIEFVDELPHTATGKLLKTALRKTYARYRFRSDTGDDSDDPLPEPTLPSAL